MVAKFVLCVLAALCTLQGSEAAQFRTAYIDIEHVIHEIIDHIKHIIDEILKKIEGLGKHETYAPWDKPLKCIEQMKPDAEKIRDDITNGVIKCSQDMQPDMEKIAEKVQEVVKDGKDTLEKIISDIKKICPSCAIEDGKQFLDRLHKAEGEIIELAKNISDEDRKCLTGLGSTIRDEAVALKDKFIQCMKS